MKPLKQLYNKTLEEKACIGKTLVHIHNIHYYLQNVVKNILDRAQMHDRSKLENPELSSFTKYTRILKDTEYGSDDYNLILKKMKPALIHHYKSNSHHPEHSGGISHMSLLDIIEMLVDWKASSLRTKRGDFLKSLAIHKERFDIDDQLYSIIVNTVKELNLDNAE